MNFKKIALISVFDKSGVLKFATELQKKFKYQIISTGKTSEYLSKNSLDVIKVSDITGFPEILGGRVKTLHPKIFGGILADLSNKDHQADLKKFEINPISLVVVNLYPFEKERTIEQIDIGGVSLIRAAGKNFSNVTVLCFPSDYNLVLDDMRKNDGEVSIKLRRMLAAKAFETTAYYDSLIKEYLFDDDNLLKKDKFLLSFSKLIDLRYGENPHQKAAFFSKSNAVGLAISDLKQVQGKALSFNNILDVDATINALSYFDQKRPMAMVVKHTNPCGAAYGSDIYAAFEKAWGGDSLAAFGGIVGVNGNVDEKLAKEMISKGFFEVLVCPEITDDALKLFSEKKNLRVLVNPKLKNIKINSEVDFKHVRGGLLVQEPDSYILKSFELKIVTKKKPTESQIKDLLFAWSIARVSKSNTIVLSKRESLVASGVGQQDRKRCCELAVSKAGKRALNCVCASDAFFPFPDGPEILIKAGVRVIIQPGGSIKDQDTIDLCDKYKISMVFTGVRCFKH